jgi:hypothetical protein
VLRCPTQISAEPPQNPEAASEHYGASPESSAALLKEQSLSTALDRALQYYEAVLKHCEAPLEHDDEAPGDPERLCNSPTGLRSAAKSLRRQTTSHPYPLSSVSQPSPAHLKTV